MCQNGNFYVGVTGTPHSETIWWGKVKRREYMPKIVIILLLDM
jgi:hypothetical protein